MKSLSKSSLLKQLLLLFFFVNTAETYKKLKEVYKHPTESTLIIGNKNISYVKGLPGSGTPKEARHDGKGDHSVRMIRGNVYQASAVVGSTAKLPCDITPPQGDILQLIMWYKDGRVSPIYSYDVRDTLVPEKQGVHWIDNKFFDDRANYIPDTNPSMLLLKDVVSTDAGFYRCRVDYLKKPTKSDAVNLTVIVPVEKLAILDKDGKHIRNYKLGPYNEGDALVITCVATGGEPPPRVIWLQDHVIFDNTSVTYNNNTRVENALRLDPLKREHYNKVFTCRAENNIITPPITSEVKLMINMRPLWVRMKGDNKPLSANHEYQLECEVVGAIPEPKVTWWKGSTNLNSTAITSPDGNITIGLLKFTPVVEDSGKYLSCRGQQTSMKEGGGMEDGWKLNIYHKPILTLELGSSVNTTVIKEGADVYFECNIKANPWIYHISWLHNGKELYNNVIEGILVSNQSLVLQGVTRAHSGHYVCVASNHEGDGQSNPIDLDIKFPPVCRPGQVTSFGVAKGELAKIPCELEGNPSNISFTWRFNNSEHSLDIPRTKVSVEPLRSVAMYKPLSENDYGSLLCWGENEIGAMLTPCVYHLIPAGKPDKLSNCTITNTTSTSFTVDCVESYDGGLPQEFVLEVSTLDGKVITTIKNKHKPHFQAQGLGSGKLYILTVLAINRKGNSYPSILNGLTLQSTKTRSAYLPILLDLNHSTALVIYGVLAVALALGLIMLSLCRRITCKIKSANGNPEDFRVPTIHEPDSSDDQNPDVVQHAGEIDEQSEEERAFDYLKTAPSRICGVHTCTTLISTRLPTYKSENGGMDTVTYPERVLQRMPPPAGATLPRPKPQPLVYAQLELPVACQALYNTVDYRTSRAGIAARATTPTVRFQLPSNTERSRLEVDSNEDDSNMIPLQQTFDGRRHSDNERF